MTKQSMENLKSRLFFGHPLTAFAILDGATALGLPARLNHFDPERVCL